MYGILLNSNDGIKWKRLGHPNVDVSLNTPDSASSLAMHAELKD